MEVNNYVQNVINEKHEKYTESLKNKMNVRIKVKLIY